MIWAMPVAPTGWPLLLSPPEVFTGISPSRPVAPATVAAVVVRIGHVAVRCQEFAETGVTTAMFGGTIVAGTVCLLLAGYWSRLLRFFPPLVTGTVITVIGVSLSVAM